MGMPACQKLLTRMAGLTLPLARFVFLLFVCCTFFVCQIAVPSRTDVPEYQKLRSMVHEIVGRINGAFGTLTYVPIHHLDRQLSFHELCALYAVTGERC
jgi:hypothetical protein